MNPAEALLLSHVADLEKVLSERYPDEPTSSTSVTRTQGRL
jgi:hypothetical protein